MRWFRWLRWLWKRWLAIALGVGPAILVILLWGAGGLHSMEDLAFDYAMRWRGPAELPENPGVAIVAIDEKSLDEVGRWPWPRSRVADLVRAIREAGAQVIALDLVFPEPSHVPPGCDCAAPSVCNVPSADPTDCLLTAEDCALAEVLAEKDDVVLGYFLETPDQTCDSQNPCEQQGEASQELDIGWLERYSVGEGAFPDIDSADAIQTSLPCLMRTTKHHGFVTNPRVRGTFRRYSLIQRLGDEEAREGDPYLRPLALSAAARYQGALPLVQKDGGAAKVSLGLQPLPTDALGRVTIDYLGEACKIPTFSAVELLQERLSERALLPLEGSLVFVGVEASGLGDSHPTPFDELMPGVEIHATVAYNLLNGRYVLAGALQNFLSLLAALMLAALAAFLVRRSQRRLLSASAGIGVVALWVLLAYLVFYFGHWHLLFVAPVLSGALSLVANLTHQIYWVDRQTKAFEGYVSPNVRRELRRDPNLAKVSRSVELTVLFTDIRGFSTRTEDMDSEQVVHLLNDFFTPMTRVVLEQDGTLDKYMGDALMAFFGAPVPLPDHAARACRAALAMRDELQVIRRSRDEMEDLDIGVGLNTGEMTVGNMGSEGLFDYTVIGKNVNLGQRLEAATKPEAFGVGILVAERTREAAGDDFLFRKVARLQAKGFQHPVTLYELIAERPKPEPPGWSQPGFVQEFEQAYALYYPGRDFAAAEAAFQDLIKRYPTDRPSLYYLERCRALRHDPPGPGWEGVEEQTKK